MCILCAIRAFPQFLVDADQCWMITCKGSWVFWFRQQRSPGPKIVNYEEGIRRISSFASVCRFALWNYNVADVTNKVESFWTLWAHICPPSTVQPTTDYLLFHSGVRRPVWEDPLNLQGGKWIIRLKKGASERLWEQLMMAVVGDQFDNCNPASFGGFGGSTGAADATTWRTVGDAGKSTEEGDARSGQSSGNDPEICGEHLQRPRP